MSIMTYVEILDINECDLNIDGCDQTCVNTVGSFLCNCTDGYELNEDGILCDGKNYIMISMYYVIVNAQNPSAVWSITRVQ